MVEIFIKQTVSTDSATLAALAALSLGDLLGTVKRNFMLKNLKTIYNITVGNIADHYCFALADADASDVEIAAALTNTSIDIEDSVAYRTGQDVVRRVWDIQVPEITGGIASGVALATMIQWKLPPKGVPVLKGRGLKTVIFNTDSSVAFSNGPVIDGIHKLQGGWF